MSEHHLSTFTSDPWRALPARPAPADAARSRRLRTLGFRALAILNIGLAAYYFAYRITSTLNLDALWFAIPLLLAELYALVDTLLFVTTMWRPTARVSPPAPEGLNVDVFITTYNEPADMVRETARAAINIRYPHHTYILDDGSRPELRAVSQALGCGYITRGAEWENRPRHAKAGNVNNALMVTYGEFILILDADQIPAPDILDQVLGYFTDPRVAFVQTPQYFYNVPPGDPFGSQAELFYGPIMQGKDGWNAAFFCGSNAVLRREALFQLGLVTYVAESERSVKEALRNLPSAIRQAQSGRQYQAATREVSAAARRALRSLRGGQPLSQVLDEFQAVLKNAQRQMVAGDLAEIAQDLADIEAQDRGGEVGQVRAEIEKGLLALTDQLSRVAAPPVETLGVGADISGALRLDSGEALDVQPLATFSITEDMATAMRLHALGWKSVFHPEILAVGLAPEDLGSALGQRLRWAAGTVQVFLRDNPLFKRGLNLGQRLQYLATMYSYFSGFASIMFLVSPVIYLLFGISPVNSYAGEFMRRIVPYLVVNKIMFVYAAWGIEVFRGEQYNLALFPVWIRASVNALLGRKLSFKVTPKTRQSGNYLPLVIPQLVITGLLAIGIVYGLTSLAVGWQTDVTSVLVNVFWAGYDILMLSVILKAAVYQPFRAAPRATAASD